MILVPSVESFMMWALPCKVSRIPAYETFMFLSLVMIHGLCHPEGQSLYVVWFGWGIFYWVRIWQKQVWFNSSHASHRSGILLVTLMRIVSQRSPFGRIVRMMSHFEFLSQMVEGVKASICLFPLRQICHGKAQHISQTGGESIVEAISSQAFPLIQHLIRVCMFHYCYCFMDSKHVLLDSFIFSLMDLIQRSNHAVIIMHTFPKVWSMHLSRSFKEMFIPPGKERAHFPG